MSTGFFKKSLCFSAAPKTTKNAAASLLWICHYSPLDFRWQSCYDLPI